MQLEESNTVIYHDNTPAGNYTRFSDSHLAYALKLAKTIYQWNHLESSTLFTLHLLLLLLAKISLWIKLRS